MGHKMLENILVQNVGKDSCWKCWLLTKMWKQAFGEKLFCMGISSVLTTFTVLGVSPKTCKSSMNFKVSVGDPKVHLEIWRAFRLTQGKEKSRLGIWRAFRLTQGKEKRRPIILRGLRLTQV